MAPELIRAEPAYSIRIWIAGDASDARRTCRQYCMEVGLCVTVTDTDYIYTGGQEAGVIVGIVNYPRFPATADKLKGKALALARRLADALCQHSFLIETPTEMTWVTTRQGNGA